MALKYFFEYKDVINNDFRCEISSELYNGDPVEIGGNCILEYPKVKYHHQVIRGCGLQLELEVNVNLTLEDLYTDDEREYKVVLTQDSLVLFKGFLNPSGLFQDFVNESWIMTLDAVDGLGLLENLAYVDQDGNPFSGKQTDIEVIKNCLDRTGLSLDMISSINMRYEGLPQDENPLLNVFSNVNRFYKEDNETIQSCKEVLESILGKYGATICQSEGKWIIAKPFEMSFIQDRYFYFANNNGQTQTSSNQQDFDTIEIGSNVDGFYPHWANENQRMEIEPSKAACKVSYKYGFVKSLIENSEFEHFNFNLDNWAIITFEGLALDSSGSGVNIIARSDSDTMLLSDSYDVSENDLLKLETQYSFSFVQSQFIFRLNFRFRVELDDGTNIYYLQDNNTWSTNENTYDFVAQSSTGGAFTSGLDLPPLPVTGQIRVRIRRGIAQRFTATTGIEPTEFEYKLSSFKLFANTDENIKGENHLSEKRNTKASKIVDTIEVDLGDNASDIYLGAIYGGNENDNTFAWGGLNYPNDIVRVDPILKILSNEILRLNVSPLRVFSGDVFGYFKYFQKYKVDLLPNSVFLPLSYRYNTKDNLISLELLELKRVGNFEIDYELTFDYGNLQKPTIKG